MKKINKEVFFFTSTLPLMIKVWSFSFFSAVAHFQFDKGCQMKNNFQKKKKIIRMKIGKSIPDLFFFSELT